jgi:hypothetical protein
VRIESSVTSVSWIPSEAIRGITKLPFELKVGHYDSAPPERIEPEALAGLRDDDRFRFANHLAGWIEDLAAQHHREDATGPTADPE